MSRKLVVNYTDLNKEHLEKIIAAASGFEVLTGDDANNAISESEVVFGYLMPGQVAANCKLKWIHAQTAGVDRYFQPEMGLDESVILTNSAGTHGISVAEHMLAFTLILMRQMHCYLKQQNQRKWEDLGSVKSIHKGLITVVGLGGIGSQYAARCKALGAVVRGVVRTPRTEIPECVDALFTTEQLDESIKEADVVALVLPNTAETVRIFNKKRMLKMKKGAFILNVGRGSAIDHDALVELLESGHLGGAGLDVTDLEPLPEDSKIWDAPNLILTPHISGGGSDGSFNLEITSDMIVDRFVEYLQDYIAGRPFKRIVDREVGY